MKRTSKALIDPIRQTAFIESEIRYLSRLSGQIALPGAWDEQLAIYEDYRNAHERLSRVAQIHGIDMTLLPPLMTWPTQERGIALTHEPPPSIRPH